MNATELKKNHEANGGVFFCRENMAVFGDTMKNFTVQPFPIEVRCADGVTRSVWVLKRKARTFTGSPVSHFYFDTETFALITPVGR